PSPLFRIPSFALFLHLAALFLPHESGLFIPAAFLFILRSLFLLIPLTLAHELLFVLSKTTRLILFTPALFLFRQAWHRRSSSSDLSRSTKHDPLVGLIGATHVAILVDIPSGN